MSLEKQIKDRAKKIGMDMCGIAPVSRFENAPKGTNPKDFLPGCKSVISIGVRLADGAVQNIMRRAFTVPTGMPWRPTFISYMRFTTFASSSKGTPVLQPLLHRSAR